MLSWSISIKTKYSKYVSIKLVVQSSDIYDYMGESLLNQAFSLSQVKCPERGNALQLGGHIQIQILKSYDQQHFMITSDPDPMVCCCGFSELFF